MLIVPPIAVMAFSLREPEGIAAGWKVLRSRDYWLSMFSFWVLGMLFITIVNAANQRMEKSRRATRRGEGESTMHKMIFFILCSFIILLGIFGAVPRRIEIDSAAAEVRPDRPQIWGAVTDGFQLSARLERAVHHAGEPVWVQTIFKNVGSEARPVLDSDPFNDYEILVFDARGNAIELTEFGKQMESKFGMFFRRTMKTMQPGDSEEQRFQIDRLYNMSNPGTYRLQINRRGVYMAQFVRDGMLMPAQGPEPAEPITSFTITGYQHPPIAVDVSSTVLRIRLLPRGSDS